MVQVERVSWETRNMVIQRGIWDERHAGTIPAEAMAANWLVTPDSLLAQAIRASRVVAVEWPMRQTEKHIQGSCMRCWRSTEPILSPVLLELYTIDNIDKCVISIGTPISSDEDSGLGSSRRCWCQLNRPCESRVDAELGHNQRQVPCARFGMSMPVIEQRRLLQLQWWNQILAVFLDGHQLGSLSLANCQLPDWAQVSIHLFSPSDGTPCITKSHMLPTEMGTVALARQMDLRGGALEQLAAIIHPASWLPCFPDIMSLGTCSVGLREMMQDVGPNGFWQDVDLQLPMHISAAFRRCHLFERLLKAWASSIASVACPPQLLHHISSLDDKIWLHGDGEYLPSICGPVLSPSTARIMYWRSERQTCQSVRLSCAIAADSSYLVLALRRSNHQSRPENSTCLIVRKPCTSGAEMWFRLADGERVRVPAPRHGPSPASWPHTFEFRWDATFLEFFLDDEAVAGISLSGEQLLEPWMRAAAMCVASSRSSMTDFAVDALPWQYNIMFGYPKCSFCQKYSLGCCQACQHWFCEDHGVLGSDICLGCVPETFLEDRLAGTSSRTLHIEKRRMDALKRLYLTFTGDISSFRRLCDRMEATQNIVLSCDGGSASATGVIQIDDSILQRLHGAVEGLEIGHFITLDTGFQTRYGNCCLSDFSLHTCLPGCVGSGHWPRSIVVATPSNFNVELLSGVAVLDVLSVLNPHPRDSSLQFREVDHSYTWNGCKVSLSVTGLIHSLVQQFNPVQALRAMRGGRNWPRAEYLVPNAVELLRGSLVHQGPPETELRRVLNSLPVDVEALCRRLRELIWTQPGYRQLATVASLTDSQILQQWERNRREAAAQGTWMHANCECLLNGGSVPFNSPEVCMFAKFLRDFRAEGWIFHRTEWAIYADEEDLAGSIDAVAQRGTDWCVLDWKRTKQLASKENSYGRRLRYPLEEVPDSVVWHYRVQLNVYAWILQQYYDVAATDLRIVCLHPDNEFSPLVISVPLMQDHMDKLMSWRRADVQSRMQLSNVANGDLRGGSQPSSPSFSQQLRQELDDGMEVALQSQQPPSVEPPNAKKPRIVMDRDAASPFMEMEMNLDLDVVAQEPQTSVEDGDILQQVQRTRELVRNFSAQYNWSAEFQHIVEGALAVHRLRLLDVSRREEVFFLELIEGGGRYIRAHEGQFFFYSSHGYWAAYTGVIPQGTLARCKSFLIHLEGLYAKFGANVLRTEAGILEAAQGLLAQHNGSCAALLNECSQAAICRVPMKGKQSRKGEEYDPEEEQHLAAAGDCGSYTQWTMAMANTIGKLYVKLHLDLVVYVFLI